jgi:YVTN family beta-propeller protein
VSLAAITVLGGTTIGAGITLRARSLPLRHIADVPLPGRRTRFDYQSVNAQQHLLYVAHLGDSVVDVVDIDTLRVIATVPGIRRVHAVLAVPDQGRIFATATGSNELVAIDSVTNKVVGRASTGRFPDGIAYDADDRLVLVSNKNDGTVSVVQAESMRLVRTVKLGDETGNVAYDANNKVAYAAVRTPDALAMFDPNSGEVAHRIRLKSCSGAHGVYVFPNAKLAFVACEKNARLVTVDLRRGRQRAITSVGSGPDVLAFDPGKRRLYVAAESGDLAVFQLRRDALRRLGQGHLADAAHTVAVDPVSHRVYFPLPGDGDGPILRVMSPS